MNLLLPWLAFLALMLVAAAPFVVWMVRSGQLTDQERARSLPLRAQIPEEGDD